MVHETSSRSQPTWSPQGHEAHQGHEAQQAHQGHQALQEPKGHEAHQPAQPTRPVQPNRATGRARYLWLAAGAALSLFAVHGHWDLAPAAWLYGIALIRFCRLSRVRTAVLMSLLVAVLDVGFWMYQAELANSPVLLLSLAYAPVLALPLILDRLLAPWLSAPLGTLVYPATRVLCELVIASFGLGTFFGVLGNTQHDNLPMLQLASVTGVYGVSFLVAWAAPVANLLLERYRGGWSAVRTGVLVYMAALLGVLGVGSARLAFAPVEGPTVRVAGVTASEASVSRLGDELERFDSVSDMLAAGPDRMRAAFEPANGDLLASTAREARAGARIVVWPESGALAIGGDENALLDRVRELARRHDIFVQVGLTIYAENPEVRNQAILVTPDGEIEWRYDKAHPIPILEPYEAGDGILPYTDTSFGRLSGMICYDGDFPGLSRQAGRNDVDIMLTPANTWRGIGKMHAENSKFRAVENGFSMVRQASRGTATITDPHGRTLAADDYFRTDRQTVVANVPIDGVRTVYARIGDAFAILASVAVPALVLVAVRNRQARQAPSHRTPSNP